MQKICVINHIRVLITQYAITHYITHPTSLDEMKCNGIPGVPYDEIFIP